MERVIRSAYDGLRKAVTVVCGPGRTKQSMKDECDINLILARHEKTGLLTPVDTRPAMFVDVSGVGDYREAIENVRNAEDLFMQLPSKVRAKFDNDPAEFLDFCSSSENEEEMRDMGLLPPLEDLVVEPVVEPAPVVLEPELSP